MPRPTNSAEARDRDDHRRCRENSDHSQDCHRQTVGPDQSRIELKNKHEQIEHAGQQQRASAEYETCGESARQSLRRAYQRTDAPNPITRPSRIVLGTRYVPDEFA